MSNLSDMVAEVYNVQITDQLKDSINFFNSFPPPPPLTRRQRFKRRVRNRIYSLRMSLASRIAGFDVTETSW